MKDLLILTFDLKGKNWSLRKKIYRSLKKIEAKLKYKSYWTLPYNNRNLENFTIICDEIKKSGGKAEVIKGERVV